MCFSSVFFFFFFFFQAEDGIRDWSVTGVQTCALPIFTVVAKLFHLVEPDLAVFGRKDFQQAMLVRRLAADLDFGLEIDVAPTVRELDGLALSSRNTYLKGDDRRAALALSRALRAVERSEER